MTKEIWYAKQHQLKIASEALPILKKHLMVYLAMEERTGKSITAIRITEACNNVSNVLIITTKKALNGWFETLEKHPHTNIYTCINYESVHKISGKVDLVILDESHKFISGYPKTSIIWQKVKNFTLNKPIIYCSATPYAQGTQMLFHQFALSKWSPWKRYSNFYDWYRDYSVRKANGELFTKKITASESIVDYTKVNHNKVKSDCKHLFISYTREELGFEHEPNDVLHYITLSKNLKDIYNTIVTKKVLHFSHAETSKDYTLVCDTPAKLRATLHMLEGGVLKVGDEYLNLGFNEKVDFILNKWGDSKNLVIMYYFKADKIKLEKYFKNATILHAQTNAEGVDLSTYKDLVIYTQNHSTAQHTQRRARQANMNRKEEINVNYLLVKGAASAKAYKTVSVNKENFVDTVFEVI
ncbi:MAG: hypothetical protein COV55_02845 [Candidatus Komeilibacteria bacterium CG11_big_fil_rev_8_21_14_0_20_36_20]|uniref:Helicase ATP-binding domain-containing protein n=1 Tax=Candidatus Komeilibacteria bacterium CG11_big_fil_rev_8_21_14_0_20_36_20 TaxID=1974477 RepID=A0A2H0NCP4_9BACT|nr:MAG: hypothetical protein COV55_02845 [Candidatus Komeilibacteria bacterium CG11_big_fil_rev_8_21_14_0_20_36_20]